MGKTVHIIRFNHSSYFVESTAAAVKIVDILSKLKACEWNYIEGGESHYCPSEDRKVGLEMEMNQPFRLREKALQLPKPKRGSRRCECGHSDVAPFESCPSCGTPHPNS